MNQEQDFYDSGSVTAHGLHSFQSITNTTTLQDDFSLPNQSDDPLVGNSSAMGVDQLLIEQMSYYIDETPSNANTNNNNWDPNIEAVLQDPKLLPTHVEELPCMSSTPSPNIFSIHPSCSSAPDLLNLLHLPAPVLPPPSAIMGHEPPLQLKFCPRPPVFGHDQYFHSLASHDNFGVAGATSTLFRGEGGVLEEMEIGGGVFQEMGGEHPMLGLRREMEGYGGKGDGRAEYTTEKQRRDLLKKQFGSLMSLVPNPSKVNML